MTHTPSTCPSPDVACQGYAYAAVTANCRSVQSVTGYWLLPNCIQESSRPSTVKENWTRHQWTEKLQTGVESVLPLQTFGTGGSDSTTSISRHQWADARVWPRSLAFKLIVTVHRCLNGRAPNCLWNHVVPVSGIVTAASPVCSTEHTCGLTLQTDHIRPSSIFCCGSHCVEQSSCRI